MVKVGQLYAWDDIIGKIYLDKSWTRDQVIYNFDTIFEITTINSSNGLVGVIAIKDRNGLFDEGLEYIASLKEIESSGFYQLIWDVGTKGAINYGVECGKCRRYYPDTIKADGFKCWGCRNGF